MLPPRQSQGNNNVTIYKCNEYRLCQTFFIQIFQLQYVGPAKVKEQTF
jgi:hypothetical protein